MKALARTVRNTAVKRWRTLHHAYCDNFIFIHINKTGGSSVEKALRLPFEHKTAIEKREIVGRDEWAKRYKFAVIRNPWDKVVSHYHFRLQTNQTGLATMQMPFTEWVRVAYRDRDPAFYDKRKMFMPQLDWVADAEGSILVDYVCRFENLAGDFQHVCQQIGKRVQLPHVKASKRGDYREYYDDASAAIIADVFTKDIDAFGYEFSSAAK